MFNGTFWGGIGVTAAAFLLIIGIRAVVGDQGEWAPLLYAVPVMAAMMFFVIRAVNKKKSPPNV